jgi:uncharacterized protein (DUF58 family)
MAVDRVELGDLIALRSEAGGLDLGSRRSVTTDLAGAARSGFRGRGMDFEEHRLYQPGDESRSIDWRVTARTGRMHVRVFREERERPVLVAVDLRRPMWFGSRGAFKSVLAARATALCAWAAIERGDRVGGLVFGGGQHEEIRPRGGPGGALRLLHALCRDASGNGASAGAELTAALQRLVRMTPGGALVVILSDYRGLADAQANLLRRVARHAEVIVGFVHDPLEAELPPPGHYPLARERGAPPVLLGTAEPVRRAAWRQAFASRRDAAQQAARACGGHWLDLCTARPVRESLERALGRRWRAA